MCKSVGPHHCIFCGAPSFKIVFKYIVIINIFSTDNIITIFTLFTFKGEIGGVCGTYGTRKNVYRSLEG